MLLGLRLGIDFDTDEAHRHLFGGRDVPELVAELGLGAVELPLGPTSDLDLVGEKAGQCIDAGLRVSLHPYSELDASNPAHHDGPGSLPARTHRRFFRLAAQLSDRQGGTIVNLHPAAAPNDLPRETLVERSVRFFAWAARWCARHAPTVRPVAELQVRPNPTQPLIRIGDTPRELVHVVSRAGVGACWDVGHAVINHRRFGLGHEPPEELWPRIAHVHCHGVEATDHQVPRRGDASWSRFLQALGNRGYGGTVILEVPAATYLDAGGLEAVRESVSAVSEALVTS